MKVAEAKKVAREWVLERVHEVPGLWGVIFGGSINWLPDDADFGPYSDVDLWHYIKGPVDPRLRQAKLCHKGLILEPYYAELEPFTNEEAILGDWRCGSHFTAPSAIYDPTGVLHDCSPLPPGGSQSRCGFAGGTKMPRPLCAASCCLRCAESRRAGTVASRLSSP